jgi:signal transduction protein with GAF and PtsI domain
MVPVVSRGKSIGIVEAYRADERAWSRAEVNRARVIANQFASVIPTLVPMPESRAEPGRARVESAN